MLPLLLRRVAVVDRQRVAVRVLEVRLPADARVDRLALELDPTGLELGVRPVEVVDVELDRVVVGSALDAERVGLHHGDRQVPGLELDRGHVAPLLRLLQAEHVAIELHGGVYVLRRHGDEVGAGDQRRGGSHGSSSSIVAVGSTGECQVSRGAPAVIASSSRGPGVASRKTSVTSGTASRRSRSISVEAASIRSASTSSSRSTRAATINAFGARTVVNSSLTSTTSSCASMARSIASRSSGRAAQPIRKCLESRAIHTATETSSRPISTDAIGSKTVNPVSWFNAMPAKASRMPTKAAVSSNSTIFTFGSRLSRAWRNTGLPASRAAARVCRSALTHDVPSATSAIPSTA